MSLRKWYNINTDEFVMVPSILANRADKSLREWFKSTGKSDWEHVDKTMGDPELYRCAKRDAFTLRAWLDSNPVAIVVSPLTPTPVKAISGR